MSARSQLLTRLQALTALGKLHQYERYSKNMTELANLYSQGGVLAGGFLRWASAKTRMYALGAYEHRHVFELVLIRGWNDAQESQLVFDQAIEQLMVAFETDQRIGDWSCIDSDSFGFELVRNEPAMFGGVLAHYAVLRIVLTK
jgi:hypothetical protein